MSRKLSLDHNPAFYQHSCLQAYQDARSGSNAGQYKRLQKETLRVINTRLTTRQRELLTRYYLDGENIPQLAKLYGLNKSTVSRHIAYAKRKIKKAVTPCLPGFSADS